MVRHRSSRCSLPAIVTANKNRDHLSITAEKDRKELTLAKTGNEQKEFNIVASSLKSTNINGEEVSQTQMETKNM